MHMPDDTRLTGAQQMAQPRSRRRFLTGVVMGGFLGSLLVGGLNLYSHAQPGPGWWFRAGHGPGGSWRQGAYDPDMVRARIEFATDWILSRIEASDEQRQQVKAIVQATVQDLAPMREQHHQNHQTMLQALTQPTIDRAALEDIRRCGIAACGGSLEAPGHLSSGHCRGAHTRAAHQAGGVHGPLASLTSPVAPSTSRAVVCQNMSC